MLQMEVLVKIQDLHTMPQLRTTLLSTFSLQLSTTRQANTIQPTHVPGTSAMDPMLLTMNNGRHPKILEMRILGTILMDTIVNVGYEVNILLEETL